MSKSEISFLSLATYNIHRFIGTDGRFDPDRIIQILKQLDADIIAIQEIESRHGEGLDLIEYFSEKTGMQYFAGLTMYDDDSNYGNALLTRLDVDDVVQHDISVQGREPRSALSVKLKRADQNIHVIATHLGLLPGERREQVKQLLKILENNPADISVLMGDLNEWFLWGRTHRWLRKHFRKSIRPATFPSKFPFLALDRIWVEPGSRIVSITRINNPVSKQGSDHLPLKAIVKL